MARRTAGGFDFAETRYADGAPLPNHEHGIPYISYVLTGAYRERVGRRSRRCSSSEFVVHPAGENHSVTFLSDETHILRIHSAQHFSGSSDVCPPSFFDGSTTGSPVLSRLGAKLRVELTNQDRFAQLAIQGLVLELIAELGRSMTSSGTEADLGRLIGQVEEYLRSEFANEISLENAARQVGVHPVHLSREFHKKKGVTFGEYLRLVRIEAACRAIDRGGKRLCDIAVDAGFYDQSHFSNTFRRVVGVTPSQYRRSTVTG